MPLYCYRCYDCGEKLERIQPSPVAPDCPDCATPMMRDWHAEGVGNLFHPTVDLYANDLKRRAQRAKDRKIDNADRGSI